MVMKLKKRLEMILNPYNQLSNIYDYWIMGDNTYLEVINCYLKIVKKFSPNEIVELGVGTGRIAIEIIKNYNIKVIGIDSSKNMLNKCQNKILTHQIKKESIELIEDNILSFHLKKQAEFIIMPFRTIGHFLDYKEQKRAIAQVYENLKKDGIFIFDHYLFDKEWALKNSEKPIEMYKNDDLIIYDKYRFDYNRQILHAQVFQNQKEIVSFDFAWIIPNQIKNILQEVGFKIIDIYGDYSCNKFTNSSNQQIWVVQK